MVPADVLRRELEQRSAAGRGRARPAWLPHASVGRRLVEVEIAASLAPPSELEESERPDEPAHAIAFADGGAAPGSDQHHSTSGAKTCSSASKSLRRQASNPCRAIVRLEFSLIAPPSPGLA